MAHFTCNKPGWAALTKLLLGECRGWVAWVVNRLPKPQGSREEEQKESWLSEYGSLGDCSTIREELCFSSQEAGHRWTGHQAGI